MPRRQVTPIAVCLRADRFLLAFCNAAKAGSVFAIVFFIGAIVARADSFTSPSATTAWNASRWNNTTDAAPYTTTYTANNNVTFTSSNNYSFAGMGATVNVGNVTLQDNSNVTFTTASSTYATGGAVRTITVGTNSTLDFGGQSFSTAAGTGFIKSGPGALELAGNTYTGGFTLNAGTVVIKGVNAMGGGATEALAINGGVLAANATRDMTGKYGAGITIGGDFQLGEVPANVAAASATANLTFSNNAALGAATRTITLGNSGTNTFSGVLSGATGTGLIVAANANGTAGALLLSGANTYDGGTTINGGRLQFAKTNSMPIAGAVTVNGGASLGINAGGAGEWTNGTSGAGTIGGLVAGTGGQGGANQVNWTANSNLAIDTTNATGGTITYGGVVGSFHTASGTTDSVGLTKLGAGTLALTGANTFTGGVNFTAGTLGIGNNSALGAGKLTMNGGQTLDPVGANRTVYNAIDVNSDPNFNDATNQFTFTGPVNVINSSFGQAVGRTISMNTSGTVTFGASPGSSTITVGIPTANGGDNVGKTLTISAASGGTIIVHDVLQDPTTGAGTASAAVKISGNGTIQLDAQNTFTGGATLSGATTTLIVGSSSAPGSGPLGTGTWTVGSSATTPSRVQTSGAQTISNNVTLASAGSAGLQVQGPDNLTLSGVITGNTTTGITKIDGGTLILSGANTYAGTTNVTGGALLANNTSGSGTGSNNITVGNGTANSGTFGGTGAVSGDVTVNSGGTLSPGAASIAKFAVGALTLNAGSTFVYEINSGVSLAAAADRLNANGALTIAASGAILSISDAGNTALSPGAKLTLIGYTGTWNGKTFDSYADDSTITVGANQYVLNYNDTSGGDNFIGGSFTKFVTLTAVPEANAFWLGGAVCSVLGLVAGTRKLRGGQVTG